MAATTNGVTNGQPTNGDQSYSIPRSADQVFKEGILDNPKIKLPAGYREAAAGVKFEGSDMPTLPVNWRFAESISSLKALEAVFVNSLLQRKYGVKPAEVVINTDHAQLFIMSALLWTIDPEGANLNAGSMVTPEGAIAIHNYFPDWDKHGANRNAYFTAATSIYRTKDDRFFHLHGSMNPRPSIRSVGLPHDNHKATFEEAVDIYAEAVGKFEAEELQDIATNKFHQAGTIAYTIEEFKQSEHGKANAHVGLWEVHHRENAKQKPSWWPETAFTSALRPLAGLKVVDMTRVIAAPAVSRGLAELGASVMRVVGPDVTDMSGLHADLNHGKWNTLLDITKSEDRAKLRDLLRDADVFLQGYRPYVLDKYGFSEKDVFELVENRERGIIYARENCYGWNGPWQSRTGWQQISDANTGVSYEFGRAMGNDEPVTPILPNSDYCTGVAGVAGIIAALLDRAEKGGSYTVDLALNYYNQWLIESCGQYPSNVWQEVWQKNGAPVYRHYHGMQYMLPRMLNGVHKGAGAKRLFGQPDFFTRSTLKHSGNVEIKYPAPILRFPNGEVKPGYQVSTRSNGVDQPRWPEDLLVEVVA